MSEAAATAPSSQIRQSWIRLSTGVELHVAEAGPRDGIPVVMLHGYTDSWFSWSRVLERLPEGVRAIVPSQRGHGDSERPLCCFRVTDFAADVVALLDALELERAHVVGHSMGGRIAQRVAIDYPERVERLVLVGSAETMANPAVSELNQAVQQLSDPVDPAFIREFQASTTATPLPPGFLDTVIGESAKVPARVWRETLARLIARDGAHDATRIQAQTLVVWGDQDAFFPREDQEALARRIPRARLVVYEGVGHSPNWEVPDRLVVELAAFLGIGSGPLLSAPDRRVELPDVSLRYRDLGGAGEAVVLLHGYSDRLESWAGAADSLRSDHRVIALDLRGFGESRVRHGARYGRAMAGDVLALLDALGLARAHLVGYSLGALVAVSTARAAPERVASLTLLAPPMFRDSTEAAKALAPFTQAIENGEGAGSFFCWAYPAGPDDRTMEWAAAADAAYPRSVLSGVLRQLCGLVPDQSELRHIRTPALVAVGTADRVLDHSLYAASAIPGARLRVKEGADHAVPMLEPWWVSAFRDGR